METPDHKGNNTNMEAGREHSATSMQTSDNGNESYQEQTVNGANEMDRETQFSFGNGVHNRENEREYKTSTPVFSHIQESSSADASTVTMEDSFEGDAMSTPTQAVNFSSDSHPRLLQLSTGDMTKPVALQPQEETSFRESSQVEPDTSTAESSTYYTAGADESVAYFTASEDSTFVIDSDWTGDLPSRSNGQGFPEVHSGELEAHNIALENFKVDSAQTWIASRSAEDARLQRSDESQLLESEQPIEATGAAHELTTLTNIAEESHEILEPFESIPEETQSIRPDNLDLNILEMICEEATSMTIKEALIHSLNPSVRAGLQDGKLLLNETEVLSLERYCESVIDNLITELLERTWSQGSESFNPVGTVEKKEKALQLSEVGLKALQKSCGRLAQDIISESIADTNILLTCGDAHVEVTLKERATTSQGSMHTAAVQELLALFQSSKDIQHYIGDLTASVINSAINKVVVSTTTGFDKEGRCVNGHLNDEDGLAGISGKYTFGKGDELQDVDSGSSETSDSQESESEFDLPLDTGELDVEATLEYDAEWDRGDVLQELHSFAPGQ